MGEETGISWADRTWSPWYGCTQISNGEHGACVACYARQLSETRMGRVVFGGPGRGEGTRDARADSAWNDPIRWNRTSPGDFVFPSMCDPFDNHPDLPPLRRRFFDLIRATPDLTWLLLTKRPGNIVRLFGDTLRDDQVYDPKGEVDISPLWPRNAAIGFTAVTQGEMNRDARHALAAFRALNPAFLFWSGEPLFTRIDIPPELLALGPRFWAITGGETDQGKHRARPTPPGAEESIRDQCAAAGVPFHRKQWGEWLAFGKDYPGISINGLTGGIEVSTDGQVYRERDVVGWPDGSVSVKVGKKIAGRLLDGVLHDARPEVRP